MRKMIYVFVIIAVLVVCRGCIPSLMGGVSKKTAAENLTQYLEKNFKGELGFEELDRFFNEGNMNPNMFRVVVYEKARPEILFVSYFDAKKILTQEDEKSITVYHKTIPEQYKDAKTDYTAREHIREHFKDRLSKIDFGYFETTAFFNHRAEVSEVKSITDDFEQQLNLYKDSLVVSNTHRVVFDMEEVNGLTLKVDFDSESDKFTGQRFGVWRKSKSYTKIEEALKPEMSNYLNSNNFDLQLHGTNAFFLRQTDFAEGVWVNFLEKKGTVPNDKGRWQDPVIAFIFVYYDLNTRTVKKQFVEKRTVFDSYMDELERIGKNLPAEYY
ncbi:hypothetical protein ABS768_07360 [Flavobacterium sp. ST-75]|uniref:Lipoprotein n=1 Tax=Flavobacterium rhizophilum TaxID=3163296 RepID=A0ABW8YBB2_9FLAO